MKYYKKSYSHKSTFGESINPAYKAVFMLAIGILLVTGSVLPYSIYASELKKSTLHYEEPNGYIPQSGPDEGDNRHPSGKDRSIEHGNSGTQGKSMSDPDDKENSNGGKSGKDKLGYDGGYDKHDQDGNNGCGNDDDFEDDNNGKCLGKHNNIGGVKPTPTPKPTNTPKPTATPKPTNTPMPTVTPTVTMTLTPTSAPTQASSNTPTPTPVSTHTDSSNNSSSNSSDSSNSQSNPNNIGAQTKGQVLGVSTLANTGNNLFIASSLLLILGFHILMGGVAHIIYAYVRPQTL